VEARALGKPTAAQDEARAYVAKGLDLARTPSVHLTAVHRMVAKSAGMTPALAAIRARTRDAAIRLVQHAERAIFDAGDAEARFATAARWAAAGSHLDPRAAGRGPDLPDADALAAEVMAIVKETPAVDDTAAAYELLKKARAVLFVHDLAADLPLDRLLVNEILQSARRVFSVVSGAPLAGRATIDDIHRAHLANVVNEVLPMGPGEIGMVWEETGADVKGKLEVVDLIVSRGQANFYALHEREKEILKPLFCLFRTQCDPVAEQFGTKGRATILKLWK